MEITAVSIITGKINSMEINVSEEKMIQWLNKRNAGTDGLIQHEFPELSAGEREFFVSGITPEEWAQHIGNEDE